MNPLCDWRVIMHPNTDVSYWDNWFYDRPHPGPLPRREGELVPVSGQRGRALVHEINAQICWGKSQPGRRAGGISMRVRGRTGTPPHSHLPHHVPGTKSNRVKPVWGKDEWMDGWMGRRPVGSGALTAGLAQRACSAGMRGRSAMLAAFSNANAVA